MFRTSSGIPEKPEPLLWNAQTLETEQCIAKKHTLFSSETTLESKEQLWNSKTNSGHPEVLGRDTQEGACNCVTSPRHRPCTLVFQQAAR